MCNKQHGLLGRLNMNKSPQNSTAHILKPHKPYQQCNKTLKPPHHKPHQCNKTTKLCLEPPIFLKQTAIPLKRWSSAPRPQDSKASLRLSTWALRRSLDVLGFQWDRWCRLLEQSFGVRFSETFVKACSNKSTGKVSVIEGAHKASWKKAGIFYPGVCLAVAMKGSHGPLCPNSWPCASFEMSFTAPKRIKLHRPCNPASRWNAPCQQSFPSELLGESIAPKKRSCIQ